MTEEKCKTKPFWESATVRSQFLTWLGIVIAAILANSELGLSPKVAAWLMVAAASINGALTTFWKTQETQTRITLIK